MQAHCGDQTTAMLCSSCSKALTLVSPMQAMLCSNVAYDSHGHRMFLLQFRFSYSYIVVALLQFPAVIIFEDTLLCSNVAYNSHGHCLLLVSELWSFCRLTSHCKQSAYHIINSSSNVSIARTPEGCCLRPGTSSNVGRPWSSM